MRGVYEPSIVVVGPGIVLFPMPSLLCDADVSAHIRKSVIPTEQFYAEIQRVKRNQPRYAR